MVIKKIGVLSLAKLMGLMYGAIGLLFGAIYALVAVVGGGAMLAMGGEDGALGGGMMMGIGLAAVVLAPILYGVAGFIAGALSAWFFNLAAKYTGGLELDVQ